MDLNDLATEYILANTVSRDGQFWLSEIEWAKLIDGVRVEDTSLILTCRDDVPRWRELATRAGKQVRSFFTVAPPDGLRHLELIRVLDRSNGVVAEWRIGELPDGRPWAPRV